MTAGTRNDAVLPATHLHGTLGELRDLYDDEEVTSSPNTFWPEDRAWFVYTDYDVSATKVSGEAALAGIVDHPLLETYDYR